MGEHDPPFPLHQLQLGHIPLGRQLAQPSGDIPAHWPNSVYSYLKTISRDLPYRGPSEPAHCGERSLGHRTQGLKSRQEHDDFVAKESPSQDVLDSFLTGAGARTEHYEIAAYEGLVTMAEAMGETEVVELLTENLEQEKTTLEKLNTIGKRLAEDGAKQQAHA